MKGDNEMPEDICPHCHTKLVLHKCQINASMISESTNRLKLMIQCHHCYIF